MVSEDGSRGRSVVEDQEWPPGFRFHPTDEELVLYYLKRKICRKKLKLSIIAETDVYKWDPEELPGRSLLKTGDRQWFFFSPRDRKYPNGARSNRATKQGYWKATGKDRIITCGPRAVGIKKTLVFYRGRAPSGERTDWVMHEYTLDEEEFKRCQNVQGYYALYKVFKKSGPGPKNGEQYGAPFREEDWNDDCPDFNIPASLDISVEKVDESSPNAGTNVNCQPAPFSDDIEEFIKSLTEVSLPDLTPINGCAFTPSQVLSQGDVKNTEVDPSCRDIAIQESVSMLYANGVQRNLQASFNLAHVTVSEIQSYEVPEVASTALKMDEQEVYVLPGEDFLEIDDLLSPEPIMDNVEEAAPNGFLVGERDGLGEFDLYHDAAMFLNDIGASPSEVANQYYVNPCQLGPGELVQPPYVQVSGGVANQPYLEVADPINNQLYLNNTDQINNQFYPDDASQSQSQASVLTSAEFYNGIGNYPDPNSGVADETCYVLCQSNQNQGGNEVNGATSWFSSAVWSFVESIPTTPASAAENALVNRAFERMSSFSRLRMNVLNASIPAGSDSEPAQKSRRIRGFIFFPVLVAFIAIFWVVLGTVNIWAPRVSA